MTIFTYLFTDPMIFLTAVFVFNIILIFLILFLLVHINNQRNFIEQLYKEMRILADNYNRKYENIVHKYESLLKMLNDIFINKTKQ